MSTPTFAKTHNLIAYLAKSTESEGFEQTMTEVKTINDKVRVQALIDEKRVNIKESSILRTLKLDDAEGTSCLANAEIFDVPKQPLRINLVALWHPQLFVLLQIRSLTSKLGDMSHHKDIYDNPSLIKKVFATIKSVGTGFSRVVTPLFDNMLVPAAKEVGLIQDDVQSITIPTEPSTSKPYKKYKSKKQQTQAPKVPSPEYRLPSPSNDPLPGGEDSLELKALMDLCTYLSIKVLELESEVIDIKSTYKERIEKLEGRVSWLEKKNRVLKDLHSVHFKVDIAAPVVKKEKSFKQERIIADIDEDIEQDEAFARQLKAELNTDINWNAVIDQVKRSERLNDAVMKYQALKRKPLTEAQARKNIIIYLKNMTGYKMNYFKGMTYKKEVEVEGHKREGESPEKEITKKQKMDEEAEELKSHLQIISIIDYKIHFERNKLYFKINSADEISFDTLEQMLNNVRLEVEEESEMYLELLRLVIRQLNEGGGLLGIMDFNILLLLFILSADASNYC
nr:hypothetical protein [Tanacetum cinerariifolium]